MEAPVSRTKLLQDIRKMRFDDAYMGWQEKRLTQEQAAEILGVTVRNCRRYVVRAPNEWPFMPIRSGARWPSALREPRDDSRELHYKWTDARAAVAAAIPSAMAWLSMPPYPERTAPAA